jgi:adenylyltransferase/sulfurtransferase
LAVSALEQARVLVIGVGGLGCPAAEALARAGVGHLTLVDPDRVELTNLHRQLLHRTPDLGRPKIDSGADALRRMVPGLSLATLAERVTETNAAALFAGHDVVVDGTDGVGTKYVLSDASRRTGVPLIFGGVLRMQGQVMVIADGGPCLRCLYELAPDANQVPTCAAAGVLGSLAGLVGGLQALQAISVLEGRGKAGVLTLLEAGKLGSRQVKVPRVPGCPGCALGLAREEAVRCSR